MKYYFCGIGGIGMSSIAQYFALNGHQVFGSDRAFDLGDNIKTKEQLQKTFGARVAELVMAETEDKHREMSAAASWQTRKEESIKDLRATTDLGVKAMWLSDKLSNLRSLYEDWRKKGSGVWQIFNQKDPAKHAWLYKSIIECLGEFKDTPEYKEYNFICQEIFGKDWK